MIKSSSKLKVIQFFYVMAFTALGLVPSLSSANGGWRDMKVVCHNVVTPSAKFKAHVSYDGRDLNQISTTRPVLGSISNSDLGYGGLSISNESDIRKSGEIRIGQQRIDRRGGFSGNLVRIAKNQNLVIFELGHPSAGANAVVSLSLPAALVIQGGRGIGQLMILENRSWISVQTECAVYESEH